MRLVDAHIGSATGHGTKMAIIAGGIINGVAPRANLYLMKIKGQWNNGESPTNMNGRILPRALDTVFDEIRRHVGQRLQANPRAKSVINLSGGEYLRRFTFIRLIDGVTGVVVDAALGPAFDAAMRSFVTWCESLKIPIVVAAGNTKSMQLHKQLPHRLGTPDNNIITVGGVEKDGSLYPDTSRAEPGQAGSMSVYAPARDIVVPAPGGENSHTGTSQAAAIVVSHICKMYLFSLTGH